MERNSVIKSIALKKLIHTDSSELIKRYVSKCTKPKNIKDSVIELLDSEDEVGNARFGAIATFDVKLENNKHGSASTSYLFSQIFNPVATALYSKGYELNMENVMKDLDDIFQDYALEVYASRKNPRVVPQFVKDVVYIYSTNVLEDKVLNPVLGNSFSV